MALCYTRLLCRRSFDLRNFRCLYTSNPASVSVAAPALRATQVFESHDEKNMRLKRPLSPHLTIYQIQLTSMLSISHRATGIILGTYSMVLAFGTLFYPGGIPCLIDTIAAWGLPSALLVVGKTLFAYPFTYHYFNGIRHLAWDMGKFLTIKEVYSTGWTVVGISAIAALALALM